MIRSSWQKRIQVPASTCAQSALERPLQPSNHAERARHKKNQVFHLCVQLGLVNAIGPVHQSSGHIFKRSNIASPEPSLNDVRIAGKCPRADPFPSAAYRRRVAGSRSGPAPFCRRSNGRPTDLACHPGHDDRLGIMGQDGPVSGDRRIDLSEVNCTAKFSPCGKVSRYRRESPSVRPM